MKIQKLNIERFKRIFEVEITPRGNTIEICGRNGQGKSSILDAIWLTLSGSSAAKTSGTTKPVRDGEKDAVVRLDLGDIVVTRRWTAEGKSTLTVESAAGKKFSSPQALLDTLVGGLAFDPLAFSRMSSKEQRTALLNLVKLDIDPDAIDAKYKGLYDERTIINRQHKNFLSALAELETPAAETPTTELSVSDQLRKLDEARRQKAEIEGKQAKLADLRERMKRLQAELEGVVAEGKALAAEVRQAVTPDVMAMEKSVLAIDEANKRIREKQKYADLVVRAETEEKKSVSITKQLEELERAKREAFANAKMPIEGLSFDEDGVLFGGVPFRQCSSAEQMKVCIAIAAALNPKIRVILVKDASLLDDESMELVNKMAEGLDIQVWLERVSDEGGDGVKVVIEDGAIRS